MRIRPSVLGSVVWTAVAAAVVVAGCGTAGDRPPAGAPAEVARSADAAATAAPAPAAAAATPDNASASSPLPTPAPMPAQARRHGTAPAAEAAPPAGNSINSNVAPGAAPKEPEPPPPPPAEVEIQWTIDDAIATPDDLPAGSVLAKFKTPDGAAIIVYRRGDRVIRRRIRDFGGSWSYLVEELDIDERPPGWTKP